MDKEEKLVKKLIKLLESAKKDNVDFQEALRLATMQHDQTTSLAALLYGAMVESYKWGSP